jgi:hypothetical protein
MCTGRGPVQSRERGERSGYLCRQAQTASFAEDYIGADFAAEESLYETSA